MNIYSIALFLHIAGTVGAFITLALEWTSLHQMRGATTAELVRGWMSISNGTRRLGMVSNLTILIAGIYLTLTAWGGVPWITVTLGTMALMIVLINTLTRPRLKALAQALSSEKGLVSPSLISLMNDPLLVIPNQIRLTLTLGIVFLMTIKPGLGGSLLTIGTAIFLGLAISSPAIRHRRMEEETAMDQL